MALNPREILSNSNKAPKQLDVRVFLTPDEVIRLMECIQKAPDESPIDVRLYRLLDKVLINHLKLRGGLDNAQLERSDEPEQLRQPRQDQR